ncbi:glycosyl hydrolase family 18 protein [Nocardioides hankookensis]
MPVDDPPPAGRKPWVTGYYAAWFWEWLYPPEEVDMTAMTHFVFGRVAPGGGSLGGDPTELMDGAWSAQEPDRAPDGSGDSIEDYLVGRAHDAGIKALLMLGGDGGDGRGFLRSTATPQLQHDFVDTIVDYLVEHDYDGVDLDWENCLDGHPDCAAPGEDPVTAAQAQQRLLGLVDAIRAEMATRDRYATTPGLLTFPGYAIKINENGGRPEPWQTEVALKVDQYNLMTYGVGTTWSGGGWLSWFSGALHGAGGLNPVDISSSVAAYEASGVPRDRIGIGIGFYGIYYGPGITAPRQSTDDNEIYEIQDAPLSYSELDRMGYFSHGSLRWDEEAQSTYRVYDGGFVPELDPARYPAGLLSYEDERSITAKGDWVTETGVGGTILWTINYGWLPGSGTNPLMDAVKKSFLE